MKQESIKFIGEVTAELRDENGVLKDTREIHNLVVSSGLVHIISRLTGTTQGIMSHVAVGTGTTDAAAAQTALVTPLDARRVATVTTQTQNVANDTIQFVATVPDTAPYVGAITEAGVFNALTDGTMLARTVFDAINKTANDTLTITWRITATPA